MDKKGYRERKMWWETKAGDRKMLEKSVRMVWQRLQEGALPPEARNESAQGKRKDCRSALQGSSAVRRRVPTIRLLSALRSEQGDCGSPSGDARARCGPVRALHGPGVMKCESISGAVFSQIAVRTRSRIFDALVCAQHPRPILPWRCQTMRAEHKRRNVMRDESAGHFCFLGGRINRGGHT